MTSAGVNLRVEDVGEFTAACAKAGVDPTAIPALAILHDDDPNLLAESFREFAGLNVAAYRCMSPNSQLVLRAPADGGVPDGANLIGWNEADGTDLTEPMPGWIDPWWQEVRSKRPDIVLHYGAPNVNNQWPLNVPLLNALDVEDAHIGSTFGVPAPHSDKPVWVTEIDIDPSRFDFGDPVQMQQAYTELLACMVRCQTAGIPVFAWGIMADRPDVAYDPPTLKQIAALNGASQPPQGETPVATPTESAPTPESAPTGQLETMQATIDDLTNRVKAIEQREALTTDAIIKELAARISNAPASTLTGPSSPAADVDAIAAGQPAVEEQAAADAAANPQ